MSLAAGGALDLEGVPEGVLRRVRGAEVGYSNYRGFVSEYFVTHQSPGEIEEELLRIVYLPCEFCCQLECVHGGRGGI